MTPPEYPSAVSGQPENYHFTEQVGHLLRKVYQRHVAIFQQNVGDSQLTAVQFITLCAVRDMGPSSLTELVQVTAVDQATIRGIVERLKARDLITVTPDPIDRRKVVVGLTDAGGALLAGNGAAGGENHRTDVRYAEPGRTDSADIPAE